jgi:ribosome-associated protein
MTVADPRQLALHLARLLDDKGGHDLLLLEMPRSALVDYVLLVTGRSDRQVKAIADEALHFCKRLRIPHFPTEGENGWSLLDCHDVVVHALSEEMRQFYRLERLWPEAKTVAWQAEAAALPRLDVPMSEVTA